MFRTRSVLASIAATTALVACNALSGADSLTIEEGDQWTPLPNEAGSFTPVDGGILGSDANGTGTSDSAPADVDASFDGGIDAAVGCASPMTIGPRFPHAATGWSGAAAVLVTDQEYAISQVGTPLGASDFGFSIPPSSTILGIVVGIRRSGQVSNGVSDKSVTLSKGISRAKNSPWPTNDVTAFYGGVSDLWEASWTPDMINSADFGVSLDVKGTVPGFVDSVSVSVVICP